jgi:hypothetical protein
MAPEGVEKEKRGIVSVVFPGVNTWATEKGTVADNIVSRVCVVLSHLVVSYAALG